MRAKGSAAVGFSQKRAGLAWASFEAHCAKLYSCFRKNGTMKLLAIYSTDEILGGGEVSFTLSMRLVRKSGWNVLAIIPGKGPLAQYLSKSGVPYDVAPLEPIRGLSGLRNLIRARPDWLRIASNYAPDLIHCNSVRAALYGQALGHKLRIPTVLSARKSESDGLIDYFLLWRLDAILCTSQVVRRRFPLWLGQEKVKLIYNAVDLVRFQIARKEAYSIRNRWLTEGSRYLVGVIGRLSPIKGQHEVIRAAPEILRQVPETRFVFVGSEDPSFPGYEEQLREDVRRLALEERFVFAGFHADVAPVYHALDLVLFPTTSEGFGRVIIEAGAARKPLIASDIDVVREVLSPLLGDLTVPVGQTEELARRTIEFLKSEDLRAEIGRRLYEQVSRSFSPQVHRDQLLQLYESLLQGRARRNPPEHR